MSEGSLFGFMLIASKGPVWDQGAVVLVVLEPWQSSIVQLCNGFLYSLKNTELKKKVQAFPVYSKHPFQIRDIHIFVFPIFLFYYVLLLS